MTEDMILTIAKKALLVTIYGSMPMLGISVIVGVFISIIQTTTSIQEQTLTFVPKLLAIFLAIMFFGIWILHILVEFTTKLWQLIPIIR